MSAFSQQHPGWVLAIWVQGPYVEVSATVSAFSQQHPGRALAI
ncbi:hypothetical protein R0011_03090 [Lacticaseibacillus rhamnosus R0011]|nr:hypothetical protein R0011_03090 [Lacticaseibacillus rhamnosus R0011]